MSWQLFGQIIFSKIHVFEKGKRKIKWQTMSLRVVVNWQHPGNRMQRQLACWLRGQITVLCIYVRIGGHRGALHTLTTAPHFPLPSLSFFE